MKTRGIGFGLAVMLIPTAASALDVGSDGSDGTLSVVSNVTIGRQVRLGPTQGDEALVGASLVGGTEALSTWQATLPSLTVPRRDKPGVYGVSGHQRGAFPRRGLTRGFILVSRINRIGPCRVRNPGRVSTLHAPRPNPFTEATTMLFGLPDQTVVSLSIYDVSGRRVRAQIRPAGLKAGWHTVTISRKGLSAGVHFNEFKAGEIERRSKLTIRSRSPGRVRSAAANPQRGFLSINSAAAVPQRLYCRGDSTPPVGPEGSLGSDPAPGAGARWVPGPLLLARAAVRAKRPGRSRPASPSQPAGRVRSANDSSLPTRSLCGRMPAEAPA